jgi:hypothetical protein
MPWKSENHSKKTQASSTANTWAAPNKPSKWNTQTAPQSRSMNNNAHQSHLKLDACSPSSKPTSPSKYSVALLSPKNNSTKSQAVNSNSVTTLNTQKKNMLNGKKQPPKSLSPEIIKNSNCTLKKLWVVVTKTTTLKTKYRMA